jgi:hypothetical protein
MSSLVHESRRAGRVLHNAALFRAAEERAASEDWILLELLCECGELDCESTLTIPYTDYFELLTKQELAIAAACPSRRRETAPRQGLRELRG